MKYKCLLLIFVIASCIICVNIYKKFFSYYTPAKERPQYKTSQHYDDTIRIAYIGDSWAQGHNNHNCLIEQKIEEVMRCPVRVSSYGIGSLTSKEIYHALFEVEGLRHFMEKGYNYCVISAGINDSSKKLSKSYYKKSINCLIRFMLYNHIRPIIIEIPDYDILDVYDKECKYDKIIRNLSMIINAMPTDCKQEYRNTLDDLIKEKGYQDKVSIIRYKSWNANYHDDLKTLYIDDHLHLNEKGYSVLDSVIVNEIIKQYSNPY